MRLLLASIGCDLALASGTTLCTREFHELPATREILCRVLTTGILVPERVTRLDELPAMQRELRGLLSSHLRHTELPCQMEPN